ncbi:MAG: ParB/RepB/Spo0J family partition protein [Alphaproteobacteria bacterium]|nr:MAG: ParB/RepB/Spo0J family partition protein [Alphaproteobacteria bacterium]
MLNKGIERLLGELNDDIVTNVDIDLVTPDPNQPRKQFNIDSVTQLAESIQKHGLLQPIIVNKLPNGHYRIIAGERRYRACKALGLATITAKIVDYDDEKTMQVSLIENIQRENLNPIDIALGLSTLLQQFNKTQEELAQEISKSRSYVTNVLRLLNLPESVKDTIRKGKISLGHAKVLSSVTNPEEFVAEIVEKKLSVRDVEKKVSMAKSKVVDNDIVYLQNAIQDKIGLPTKIDLSGKGGGKITLKITDISQLDTLLEKLRKL